MRRRSIRLAIVGDDQVSFLRWLASTEHIEKIKEEFHGLPIEDLLREDVQFFIANGELLHPEAYNCLREKHRATAKWRRVDGMPFQRVDPDPCPSCKENHEPSFLVQIPHRRGGYQTIRVNEFGFEHHRCF